MARGALTRLPDSLPLNVGTEARGSAVLQRGRRVQMFNCLSQGDPQVPRSVAIVNRAGAVAEKPARDRRATCRNRQRIQQGIEHLLYVRFARHDGFAVERRSRSAHGRWSASLPQKGFPALDQCTTRHRCDEHVSSGRQESIRLRRTAFGELAIEGGNKQSANEAGPSSIASNGQMPRVVLVDQKQCRLASACPLTIARPVMANHSKEPGCRHHAMVRPGIGI